MLFRKCLRSALLLYSIPFLYSQTSPAPGTANNPTFKAKVQVVLVDVVVTDRNGNPIVGLKKSDFDVFEGGNPQTVLSFEEHRGEPTGTVTERPPLPPHFYTNAPQALPSSSINVLLLDALNTQFADQAAVRQQMIKYLKTIDPGPRLAIFTLGEQLRMVEGFTTDPHLLLAALNHKGWGGMPQLSHLQPSPEEDDLEQQAFQHMNDLANGRGQNVADAVLSLQSFLAETKVTETTTRVSVTLQVLQTLARYLSAFPGRKNLIWFSGSFPQIDFPSMRERMELNTDASGLGGEIKKTINLLASAQVAVYPISARGPEVDTLFGASTLSPEALGRGTAGGRIVQGMSQSLVNDDENRYFNQNAANNIAINTGGKSFFNTNGLKEALTEAVHQGSYYYRLSYSPSDKRMLGRYRRIQVKVKGHYTLGYRRGYFEETQKQAAAEEPEPADPLHALMARGLPDSTQIVYKLGVLPSNTQSSVNGPIAGDNGALRGPVKRFGVNFVIPVNNLDFEVTPDGIRHGHLELSVVIYDHDGRPLNWVQRSFQTSLKPDVYPAVRRVGIRLHLDIDVPKGDLYVRTGVYDFGSTNAGTLEVPLTEVEN